MREINICEIFQKREQLQREYRTEAQLLEEKYASELARFRPAYKEYQESIGSFNRRWDIVMAPYRKEMKALTRKYNRLLKQL